MKQSLMPTFFIGHGSPMNALEVNVFTSEWRRIAALIPKPSAILCLSAHWETAGTWVTAMNTPRTIHDFGGFPHELYKAQYPAAGDVELTTRIMKLVKSTEVLPDDEWGLDHGTWSILMHLYPNADVPVVQLSLDDTITPDAQYALGKELAPLREEGVLIIGSGNVVHNLNEMTFPGNDFNRMNEPYAADWATLANDLIRKHIAENNHEALVHFADLGANVLRGAPTPEHFLPLLYILALQKENESPHFFNDTVIAGSLSMLSVGFGL